MDAVADPEELAAAPGDLVDFGDFVEAFGALEDGAAVAFGVFVEITVLDELSKSMKHMKKEDKKLTLVALGALVDFGA